MPDNAMAKQRELVRKLREGKSTPEEVLGSWDDALIARNARKPRGNEYPGDREMRDLTPTMQDIATRNPNVKRRF